MIEGTGIASFSADMRRRSGGPATQRLPTGTSTSRYPVDLDRVAQARGERGDGRNPPAQEVNLKVMGQTSCVLAGLGYFVSSSGQAGEVSCPAGETTLAPGATSCVVTPASLCTLTLQLADGSAKYQALTVSQRTAFNKTVSALCAADLTPITSGISSAKKALLIGHRTQSSPA